MMMKGSEPPDSPPPPYPGCGSPDSCSTAAAHDSDSDQKYPQKPQQQGPIIHGPVPSNRDPYDQEYYQRKQYQEHYRPHHYQHFQHGHQHPAPPEPYLPAADHAGDWSAGRNARLSADQEARWSGGRGRHSTAGGASSGVIIGQQPRAGSSRQGAAAAAVAAGQCSEIDDHQPNSYLALAIVTCLCFSPLLGLIAICFSAASHSAYESGNKAWARSYGHYACALSITGIILSLIILIILLFGNFVPH